MSYESGIVCTVNPIYIYIFFLCSHVTRSRQVIYREYSRWCRAQCFRLFTSKTSVSSLITCVQLNLAIITVHFNYDTRGRGHYQASFDVGRTNWMPIKNLKEQTNAWWDSFFSENGFSFAEEWRVQFRINRRSLFKPADEIRVNPRTCGRESSIWIRCVWTWKFLNAERKNLRIKKYPDTCGRDLRGVSNL